MYKIRHSAVFALLTLLFTLPVAAQTISIAEARALPLGTAVTVEGAVTVPSGAFVSSTFDQGFAIEDDTAGIYISIQTNNGFNYNRLVRVTGTLADDGFGQLVIFPGMVAAVGGAQLVEATLVATGDVGEGTEGSLVRVVATVTRGPVDDTPFGYSFFVDDGTGERQIFVPVSTGVNPFLIPFVTPGNTVRVTGLSSQFLANLEVLPRRHGDIQLVQ